MSQMSFSNFEYAGKRKQTRRARSVPSGINLRNRNPCNLQVALPK
jgi:hypothetical protein